MAKGNARCNRGTSEPITLFILEMKKSEYLKYANNPTLNITPALKSTLGLYLLNLFVFPDKLLPSR